MNMTKFAPKQVGLIRVTTQNWSQDKAIKRAAEELLELSLALLHFDRHKATIEDILNEMADVKIVLKHLEIRFGCYQAQLDQKVIQGNGS